MFKRKRITVLGVSLLAALGLMSISAAGAQAGKWTIDGKAYDSATSAYFESAGGPVKITGGGSATFECAKQKGTGTLWYAGNAKTYITLSGCVWLQGGLPSETCLIQNEKIEMSAEMVLSQDGSKVVFRNSGIFGQMVVISVEYGCPLISGEKQVVNLDGEFTATVGSPAVKLPLSISSSKFFVGIWGMENSEIKGSSSMWLTGANAGKTLGTISS